MLGKRVINNIMTPQQPLQPLHRMKRMRGLKRIKGDLYSKCKAESHCVFCDSKVKKPGNYIKYAGKFAFICDDCEKYRDKTPDWEL